MASGTGGDWVFNSLGVADKVIISPYLYSTSVLNFGVICGALVAALLAGQFRVRGAPPFELFKGLVGGVLMGVGAAMAFGCNIGGFFSAISALSMAGMAMMLGLMLGVYIGLRLLILEVTYLNFSASTSLAKVAKEQTSVRLQRQKILGALLLVGGLVLALTYDRFDLPGSGWILAVRAADWHRHAALSFLFCESFPGAVPDRGRRDGQSGNSCHRNQRNRFFHSEVDRPARLGRFCVVWFLVRQFCRRGDFRRWHVTQWRLCHRLPVARRGRSDKTMGCHRRLCVCPARCSGPGWKKAGG